MSVQRRRQGVLRQPSLVLGSQGLRPQGYLFNKPIAIDLSQAHLLGETVQARREGRLKDYIAPPSYQTFCKTQQEKIQHKHMLHTDPEDRFPVGDTPNLHEQWPQTKHTGRFRIMHTNVHGLHPGKNNLECDYYLQRMAAYQVDMSLAVEVNQPVDNPTIRNRLRNTVRGFDKHAHVQFGHGETSTEKVGFQMGGEMTVVQGGAKGFLNESGSDPVGRWTWTNLGKAQLHVVSAYRVGPGNDGINTIRANEMRRLLKRRHPLAKTPRKAFDHDIAQYVETTKTQGHPILLCMDANSGYSHRDIKELERKTGLINIIQHFHPDITMPRTYDRGRDCIDFVLGCEEALKLIKKCGYLEFYALTPDDHRAFFIDLDTERLQQRDIQPVADSLSAPSLAKPSQVHRFLEEYKMLLDKAGLVDKVEQITTRFQTASDRERIFLAKRLNKYDSVWVQLAIAAAKKAAPTYGGTLPWSPALARAGSQARYWNQRLQCARQTGDLQGLHIALPLYYIPPDIHTESDIEDCYLRALDTWHTTKGSAADLRKQHLEDLIAQTMLRQDLSREKALKQLLQREELRNLHRRQGAIMGNNRCDVITSLVIPSPSSANPNATMEITDSDQIQSIILRRNAAKLGAAKHSIFNQPRLLGLLGEHGDTDTADALLTGTFDTDAVDSWEEIEHKDELKAFLRNMRRPLDEQGNQIPDMTWTYGAQEFRDTFSKKRETTGCGPSGITMHFYRIFCEDDALATFHSRFIMLPFRYGFSLDRWQQSVHFMLKKLATPRWEKLRIIQLLEGDFNGGLRYLFGRRLMRYADKHKISTDSTYGGRTGKNCHDALLRLQLAKEYLRIMRIPSIGVDVDASACFDRQLRNLIGALNRRSGAPKEMNQCQTRTLGQMTHKVKTAQGVSDGAFQHSKDRPIFGSGQGSGAGVPNWHSHNETIISAYKEFHPGITMTTPGGTTTVDQHVVSFVDDNTLLDDCSPDVTPEEMFRQAAAILGTWQILMWITGGAVELPKCYLSLMAYDFDTYSLKKHGRQRGIPILKTVEALPGDCTLTADGGTKVTIQKVQPTTGHRLLGVRLAADGNFNDEYTHRCQQAQTQAGRLLNSTATPHDAYMIYTFRYCPALFYCLRVTYFTQKECDKIQAPFMNVLLPKLRINRHIKRAVVWGPPRFGGLGFKDMSTEQLVQGTEHAIKHIRSATATGRTFIVTASAYQLYLGTNRPFFRDDPSTMPHRLPATRNRMTFLWEELSKIDCYLDIPTMWTPESHRLTIMDTIVTAQQRYKNTPNFITDEFVRLANTCRLWLRVIYLDDIGSDDNELILAYYNGDRQSDTHSFAMPHQEKPPQWVWKVWQEVLRKSCLTHRHPLTSWYTITPERNGNDDCTIFSPLPCLQDRSQTLEDIVAALPSHYRHILGEYELPEDDGAALARDLATGALSYYSDGTAKEGCAAHAYTLRPICDDNKLAITGGGPTSGDPDTLSSLRPEHSGTLAGSIWIWILEFKYDIHDGNARSGIDNSAVITRLSSGHDEDGRHINTLATDFDLWQEHMTLLDKMTTSVSFFHVKGHQDDLHHKEHKEGPMTRDAHWNIAMDKLAESFRLPHPTPLTTVYNASGAALVHDQKVVTTKIGPKIRDLRHSENLRQYIQTKEGWETDVFDSVDWPAFEACLKRLTIHKRINVVKYIFNWQNTGRQKQLFEQSNAAIERRAPENVGRCPMGCGQHEDSQHYLRCKKLHDTRAMDCSFGQLQKWMKKAHTHPEMEVILIVGLKHWTEHQYPKEIWELTDSPVRDKLEEAIQEQNQIGWGNVFKGRISTVWGEVQMHHYAETYEDIEIPQHLSATWWASEFLRQVIYMSLNAWQHRNDFLHDREATEKKMNARRDTVETMAHWYNKKHQFPLVDQSHFARTFLDRCTDTTAQIRLWIGKITDLYEYNQQTTMRGFLTTQ